jgi:putative CocE/NonD family hydrolase
MPRIVIDPDVRVPMRDGVELAADVYRLDQGQSQPVLLFRTPYDRGIANFSNIPVDVLRLVYDGFAVVIQDTRGRHGSQGSFAPFTDDEDDGADTVAWARAEPWSDGRVGMFGASYVGATQWLGAVGAGDGVKAIAPVVTSADPHSWLYRGGAFELGFALLWSLVFLSPPHALRTGGDVGAVLDAADAVDELYGRTPLTDLPMLAEAPWYADWVGRPERDAGWTAVSAAERFGEVTAPALIMAGWHDIFAAGSLASYTGLRTRGGSAAAREQTRLVVGPWAHGVLGGSFVERSFGIRAAIGAIDVTEMHSRWFDAQLRNGERLSGKRVLLFVMGPNVWREEDDWPLPDTAFTPWYLHSRGDANTAAGGGVLSPDPPGEEPEDVYAYDPLDPVPTVGGATFLPGVWLAANGGPRDQSPVERRKDVLCYTSEPLPRPLEVTGPVRLVLYVSSSATDTDFTGKLVDVGIDGRAEIVTDGILRARYRESLSDPVPLEAGEVTKLEIDLGATSYVFPAGHRVRIDVSSSNFPRFDRNTNTGGVIASERIEEALVARNAVHHRGAYPSHVVLPLIER